MEKSGGYRKVPPAVDITSTEEEDDASSTAEESIITSGATAAESETQSVESDITGECCDITASTV